MPTRANPWGSNFPLPTTFPNYENTRFLVRFGGGDGVRFRLPLFLSDRQSVPGLGRAVFSYGLRLDIRRAYNICGQMVSAPPSLPPRPLFPPLPLSVPSPPTPAPRFIRFLASPLRAASRLSGDSIRKSSGHPLRKRASALACCPPQKYPETHPTTLCGTHQ